MSYSFSRCLLQKFAQTLPHLVPNNGLHFRQEIIHARRRHFHLVATPGRFFRACAFPYAVPPRPHRRRNPGRPWACLKHRGPYAAGGWGTSASGNRACGPPRKLCQTMRMGLAIKTNLIGTSEDTADQREGKTVRAPGRRTGITPRAVSRVNPEVKTVRLRVWLTLLLIRGSSSSRAQQLQVFADAVESDDGIVHRIAHQRQQRRHNRQRDLFVEQRE